MAIDEFAGHCRLLGSLRLKHEKLREHYFRVSRELSEADNDDEDEEYVFKPREQWTVEDEDFYAVVQQLEESSLREVHDAIWRLWKDVEAQICEITGEEVDDRCPLTGHKIYW